MSATGVHHRLRQVLVTSHTKLALDPNDLQGYFLLQVYDMCGKDLQVVLELAGGGAIDCDRARAPREHNGLVETIQFVLHGSCEASHRLLRLLTCWH